MNSGGYFSKHETGIGSLFGGLFGSLVPATNSALVKEVTENILNKKPSRKRKIHTKLKNKKSKKKKYLPMLKKRKKI